MSLYPDTSHQPIDHHTGHPWVSWAAVLAGVVTTIAVQIALSELCLACGLAAYGPDSSMAAIAVGTVAAWLFCALISVFAGGWVVGRMKHHVSTSEAVIHGGLVWAMGAIGVLVLATMSVGVLAGGAFSLLGQGISGAAQGAGSALPAAVQAAAPSWADVKKEVDQAMVQRDADSKVPVAEGRYADRSRLMELLGSYFTMDGRQMNETDREELKGLVANQLGISPAAAQATLDQWQHVWRVGVARFEAAKADASRRMKEAADLATRRMSQAAIAAFFAMIVGLGAAIAGALCGSACARPCTRSEALPPPSNPKP